MNVRSSIVVFLVALTACIARPAEGKRTGRAEQTHFSAEDTGVKSPVAIPDGVLTILRQDEMVGNVMENAEPPQKDLPATWFSASVIHLGAPDKKCFVVVAGGPLAGANVTTFWVFCSTPHGDELVLTAPAHDLVVMRTRWKGYREIEMLATTAVRIHTVRFRFDGQRYTIYRDKWEPI